MVAACTSLATDILSVLSKGPVATSAMPLNYQNGKTHLQDLPPELLILIFKSQTSIADALHFAATCHSLHNLYESEHAIATTILQREIPCYDKALEVARAQLPDLQPQHPHTLTKQILLNARDAARVLCLASAYFLAKARGRATPCPIHSVRGFFWDERSLLPHERTRILHSWYFLKLYHASLSPSFGEERHQLLHQELQKIGLVHSAVQWEVAIFVIDWMDDLVREDLGIEDPDPPDVLVGIQASIPTLEWEQTQKAVEDVYWKKRNWGHDEYEKKLKGPCDICPLPGEAACKAREPGKGLWEL